MLKKVLTIKLIFAFLCLKEIVCHDIVQDTDNLFKGL